FYLCIFIPKYRPHHVTCSCHIQFAFAHMYMCIEANNTICIGLEAVITKFINYISGNKHKSGESERKSHNVEQREHSVLCQISKSNFKIIFDHLIYFIPVFIENN